MTDESIASPPVKRGRGRPKIVQQDIPLVQTIGTKAERLQALFNQWWGCKRCFLGEERERARTAGKEEVVFGDGNPDAHIVIVGEAPGEEEDKTGIPFVGNSGKLLNQILAATTEDEDIQRLYEDYGKAPRTGGKGEMATNAFHEKMFEWRNREFFITNAVACRPPENRQPTNVEIKACWERVWNTIYIVDPLLIIAAGGSALSGLVGKAQIKISTSRGTVVDVTHNGHVGPVTYPLMPIYHPSFLLRKADWKLTNGDYAKTVEDVRKALRVVDFLRHKHFGTPIPQR